MDSEAALPHPLSYPTESKRLQQVGIRVVSARRNNGTAVLTVLPVTRRRFIPAGSTVSLGTFPIFPLSKAAPSDFPQPFYGMGGSSFQHSW